MMLIRRYANAVDMCLSNPRSHSPMPDPLKPAPQFS
jgi:hypothetical protein